jgi:hypothetical protein
MISEFSPITIFPAFPRTLVIKMLFVGCHHLYLLKRILVPRMMNRLS